MLCRYGSYLMVVVCVCHVGSFLSYSFRLPCFSGSDVHESLDQCDKMFKPGWKDIFHINRNELESEIRRVSTESSLDPRREDYLFYNLMTRFVPAIYICI